MTVLHTYRVPDDKASSGQKKVMYESYERN